MFVFHLFAYEEESHLYTRRSKRGIASYKVRNKFEIKSMVNPYSNELDKLARE